MTALAASPLIWLALAAFGGTLVLSGRDEGNADVRQRLFAVGRRMLRWGLVPVAVILMLPGPTDEMRTALIAALLVVGGWFVTFLFQQEERAGDQIDLMIAIRAEAWVFLNDLRQNAETDHARGVLAELESSGGKAAAFFPQPAPPLVFEANAGHVARLPSEVVDEVVQFYSLLGAVRQFALELREPLFLARPQAVRRHAYVTYFKNYRDLGDLADAAVVSLNRAIGVPSPEATGQPAPIPAINIPDRGQSAPAAKVSDVADRKP